jgi:hypothetical protein
VVDRRFSAACSGRRWASAEIHAEPSPVPGSADPLGDAGVEHQAISRHRLRDRGKRLWLEIAVNVRYARSTARAAWVIAAVARRARGP